MGNTKEGAQRGAYKRYVAAGVEKAYIALLDEKLLADYNACDIEDKLLILREYKKNANIKLERKLKDKTSSTIESDPYKSIQKAFKDLYKAIEKHAPTIGENIIETIKEQVNSISGKTEEILDKTRQQAIDAAEEELRKAQQRVDELKKKYGK